MKLTVAELKLLCKNNSILNCNTLKKNELIKKINNNLNKKITSEIDTIFYNKFKNNESFGITCEYVLCTLYDLNNRLENRIHTKMVVSLTNVLKMFKYEFKIKYNLNITKFIGHENKSIDFIANNLDLIDKKDYTLSIKSNFSSNKICPQNIGQPTKKSFIKKIKLLDDFKDINIENTNSGIKIFIINNFSKLINEYFNNLFCCDFTLYILKNKTNKIEYKFLQYKKLNLNFDLLFLTKDINEWKESNILKYRHDLNDLTIGEFQIHKNRDCIKFRFILSNLIKILNDNNSNEFSVNELNNKIQKLEIKN